MKANADGRRSATGLQSGVCKKEPLPPHEDCNNGICVKYLPTSTADLASALTGADIALVFVGTTSSEGGDRGDLTLSNEDDLIRSVTEVLGKKTVVVAVTPGALLTPWRDDVGAILTPFMPGQEYGNAIGDVLFGMVNPSARLPVTFPAAENDIGMIDDQYPGRNGISTYSEGLEVGYRWYSAHGATPAFAFGHGLSYTQFEYSDLRIQERSISCVVKNIGEVDGAEVPQLYLGFPAAANEPPKQLKGFTRVTLKAGASTTVSFKVTDRDLSIWDGQWSMVSGDFDVMVGASSEDIRMTGVLNNAFDSSVTV